MRCTYACRPKGSHACRGAYDMHACFRPSVGLTHRHRHRPPPTWTSAKRIGWCRCCSASGARTHASTSEAIYLCRRRSFRSRVGHQTIATPDSFNTCSAIAPTWGQSHGLWCTNNSQQYSTRSTVHSCLLGGPGGVACRFYRGSEAARIYPWECCLGAVTRPDLASLLFIFAASH